MKRVSLLFTVSFLVLFTMAIIIPAWANNLNVENVSLTDQNTTSHYTHIQFDISWDNSWRTSSAPNNWDTARAFAKYKVTDKGSGSGIPDCEWRHCTINTDGHTPSSGSTIDAASDPISNENALYEGSITWDRSESLWCGAQTSDGLTGGCAALGANYPKGYKAIYCMKYEISQGQYADFLSLLTDSQDDNRYPNENGEIVSSGIYFLRIVSGSYCKTNKMIFIR